MYVKYAHVYASCISIHLIDYNIGLVSLFNGISTFVGYLMAKPSVYKNSSCTSKNDPSLKEF